VHNEYLEIGVETGLPGTMLVLALVLWGFLRLGMAPSWSRTAPAAVALAGVTLHANVDYIWHFPEVPIALGLLVGAGCVSSTRTGTARKVGQRTFGVPIAATLALWIVLLLPLRITNPLP